MFINSARIFSACHLHVSTSEFDVYTILKQQLLNIFFSSSARSQHILDDPRLSSHYICRSWENQRACHTSGSDKIRCLIVWFDAIKRSDERSQRAEQIVHLVRISRCSQCRPGSHEMMRVHIHKSWRDISATDIHDTSVSECLQSCCDWGNLDDNAFLESYIHGSI